MIVALEIVTVVIVVIAVAIVTVVDIVEVVTSLWVDRREAVVTELSLDDC